MSRRRVVTYNAAEADQPEAPRRAGLFSSLKSLFVSSTEAHSGAYGRARGYMIPGGGASHLFESPREWRGSTRQVCGMWPFAAGSSTPFSGAPMGIDIDTNAPVGCDPIAWFVDGIINNPSVFILGLPGYGKSTFVRHMLLGMNGRGIVPLIPGDLKPDYVDEITAMGGQVIQLAPGRGHLNILDPGELSTIADSLPPKTRERLMVDAHSRKLQMLSALISILRKGHITPHEETILDAALTYLEEHHEGVPVVQDLLDVIVARPQALQDVALDRGDEGRYRDATDALVSSLMSLNGQGRFGDMFSKPTTARLAMDRPAVFDISQISDIHRDVQAAALLACWSTTFASVEIAHTLADEGLAPRRNYFVVLDELWRALRAGADMVDRIDSLTRLNRRDGVGQAMITHTMSDLDALATESEREKARGFVERSGLVITGALPQSEMAKLRRVMPLSQAESARLVSWADPGSWSRLAQNRSAHGAPRQAPGVGKFMVKVGGRPGISVMVRLTQVEIDMNNTNKRWGNSDGSVHVASGNEVTNALVGMPTGSAGTYGNTEIQESVYEDFGISVQSSGLSETSAQQSSDQPPVRFSSTTTAPAPTPQHNQTPTESAHLIPSPEGYGYYEHSA